MTTRPTLASVIIPSQHQQVTTQQEQTQTHSSQPPIFSKPPFKPQNTQQVTTTIASPSTSSQYDPENNWQISRKRQFPIQQISNHKNKIIKMNNIEDLVPDAIRKIPSECLKLQKPREENMNKENPRYVNTLLYFLKPNYNKFEVASKINIIQSNGHQQILVNSEKLPVLKTFSLPTENNKWKIKNRDPKNGTYTLRNNMLDAYIEVPYDAISAFPVDMPELSNINTSSLIEENTTFRQELFQKETELQELQLKFEQLKMESQKPPEEKQLPNDYWRRQYVVAHQLQKTSESNAQTMLKTFSLKHLEITNANKKLGEKNLELGKKITQLMKENEEQKTKISELKRRVKKHKKRQSMDKDKPTEDDIQEVLLIEDDGNSPMSSPVILPPEFFE